MRLEVAKSRVGSTATVARVRSPLVIERLRLAPGPTWRHRAADQGWRTTAASPLCMPLCVVKRDNDMGCPPQSIPATTPISRASATASRHTVVVKL